MTLPIFQREYVDIVEKAYADLVEQISNLDDEVAEVAPEENRSHPSC